MCIISSLGLIAFLVLWTDAGAAYNSDEHLTTPQLIRKYGYPAESHTIQTEDGYLLTLHRIPHGRSSAYNASKIPVFLQHGLLSTSATWVLTGLNKSLPLLLADLGFDVWLGNARGNTYSRAHVSLDPDDYRFWDFSFHEMGVYDLPAAIDWVLGVTGHKELVYVGHSMGTTMFYVMASERPEYNRKVKLMKSLAPVAFMGHVKSPIRLLTPFTRDLEFISKYLGKGEFLPHNKILQWLGKYGCEQVTFEKKICEETIFIFSGFDEAQFNMSLLPVILGHEPAGTSTKTIIHYAQEIKSGKFQYYDNSTSKNFDQPKEYDLSNIMVPLDLHYADNDWLASPVDVKLFAEKLKTKVNFIRVPLATFNHVDFVWAKDLYKLLYESIIKTINKQ
ncbi:lipase 3-like [Periplaneta americana]|uniref:lipase 3-like n=1 Tax=Periplaneta americana TaxID=6978 RepID=UPI0037E929B9